MELEIELAVRLDRDLDDWLLRQRGGNLAAGSGRVNLWVRELPGWGHYSFCAFPIFLLDRWLDSAFFQVSAIHL